MLDKTRYSSWASRMLLYIKGKENGKLLVDSVLNGPFKYGTVTEPGTATTPATVRDRRYDELTDTEKILPTRQWLSLAPHLPLDTHQQTTNSEPRLTQGIRQLSKMEKLWHRQFREDKIRGMQAVVVTPLQGGNMRHNVMGIITPH
ncbi:hypothetical protein Tco_1379918 [Tanacetum coccineum]